MSTMEVTRGRGSLVISCGYCAVQFRVTPTEIRRGKKFCSRRCYGAASIVSTDIRDHADRFWKSVDRSGGPDACWPWTGSFVAEGYGVFWYAQDFETAHRAAWRIAHGPIAPETPWVLHSCDNPPCCNPYSERHLRLGTPLDNARDRESRGRGASHAGELCGRAKLNEAQVREIRARAAGGESRRKIAASYGVSRHAIKNVVLRQTWWCVHDSSPDVEAGGKVEIVDGRVAS